jgi:hypothetical protein
VVRAGDRLIRAGASRYFRVFIDRAMRLTGAGTIRGSRGGQSEARPKRIGALGTALLLRISSSSGRRLEQILFCLNRSAIQTKWMNQL